MKRRMNASMNPRHSDQGFTMIEVIVAMLIFAIGIVAIMKIQPQATRATVHSQQIAKATNYAQERIEYLRGLTFNHADLNAGTHTDPDSPLVGVYRRDWNVAVDTPMSGMKKVDVTVIFPTLSNDSLVTLTTYVTRF